MHSSPTQHYITNSHKHFEPKEKKIQLTKEIAQLNDGYLLLSIPMYSLHVLPLSCSYTFVDIIN